MSSDRFTRLADGNLICSVCGCLVYPGFQDTHDATHIDLESSKPMPTPVGSEERPMRDEVSADSRGQVRHLSVLNAMREIPRGDWQANRYDTDDELVLHLHNEKGDYYDIRVPKVQEDDPEVVAIEESLAIEESVINNLLRIAREGSEYEDASTLLLAAGMLVASTRANPNNLPELKRLYDS